MLKVCSTQMQVKISKRERFQRSPEFKKNDFPQNLIIEAYRLHTVCGREGGIRDG